MVGAWGSRRVVAAVVVVAVIALGCSGTDEPHRASGGVRVDDCTAGDLASIDRIIEPGRYTTDMPMAVLGTADPAWSVARLWNEVLLAAIRRDFPAPTVHARSLMHLSVLMWSVWAGAHGRPSAVALGDIDTPRALTEATTRDDAIAEAISFGAHRLLSQRYDVAVEARLSLAEFDAAMAWQCFDPSAAVPDGSAAAFGLAVADAVLDGAANDNAREADLYIDRSYEPVNEPLTIGEPGTRMADADRWQPLQMEQRITQNGIDEPSDTQIYLGSHWGHVTPFALAETGSNFAEAGAPGDGSVDYSATLDPGPPPRWNDPDTRAQLRSEIVDVLRASAALGAATSTEVDISPASRGNNSVGSNDGVGYPLNPVTGQPYAPSMARSHDIDRVLAEYWADGPKSETPPGHWNVIANEVGDELASTDDLRLPGTESAVDRLEWDTTTYLALNGALHDAAIAAWGTKTRYDSARPVSMIRFAGGKGQSSDPAAAAYHADGLPLVEGLIEVVTKESSAPGQRHSALSASVGEVAVFSWQAPAKDDRSRAADVGWIRAVDWRPYQPVTFVTPAFPGYVSGHSTYSRAAAEVLATITGTAFVPGGLDERVVELGFLRFEQGPTRTVAMQWATYFDAADMAGRSRVLGGIHTTSDDFAGRRLGRRVAEAALERAGEITGRPLELVG